MSNNDEWCIHMIYYVYNFLMLHNAEAPYSNEHLNVIAIIFKKNDSFLQKMTKGKYESHVIYRRLM